MPFATWLEADVDEQLANNAPNVHPKITHLYRLPSQQAIKYKSMWAYGNYSK
jgi:hypothetical protein